MAHQQNKIYLGYEDECITEKNKYQVNFTTSKIGGKPDWPFFDIEPKNPECSLCGLKQLLIVQLYAPLENSPYHRVLYVFACINPNCWNQNESWTCLRSQYLDQTSKITNNTSTTSSQGIAVTDWLQDADDWEDEANDNISEENGNLINEPSPTSGHRSDDEDESFSMEDSLRAEFEELYVDNKNANNGKLLAEAQGGAVGKLQSPTASAEIEGEESEVVSIDTPTFPQHNLLSLLQEVTPLPASFCQKNNKDAIDKIEFCPVFISIGEEEITSNYAISEHIRDLINEYQMCNEEDASGGGEPDGAAASVEKYERSSPFHGDKLSHYFISKIQMNPGQILRYSRGNSNPLIIAPITDAAKRCQYCKSSMTFEMQILPTIIPKLHLLTNGTQAGTNFRSDGAHVEFGNVLIFTCDKSCWNESKDSCTTRQEVVVVQSERY